jgi:hypothetical protein
VATLTAALVGVLALGCGEERDFDAYPITLERSGGTLLGAADVGEGPAPVAIDVLSPLSSLTLESGDGHARVLVDLLLHGFDADGQPIARSRVRDLPILALEPCASPPCLLGDPATAGEIAGIVGADVLSHGGRAARFDFVANQLSFFDGIAGSRGERGGLCEAVMSDPFGGGGTIRVDGAEVSYPARRPALGTCLAPGAADDLSETGTDVLFVLSTGVGKSLLSRSAWDRLAARPELGLAPADALPRGEVLLPTGAVEVGIGVVPGYALLGDLGTASENRGACRELLANRLMSPAPPAPRGCGFLRAAGLDPEPECPCPDDEGDVCDAAPAVVLDRALEVGVIDDGHPLMQSLRDELRPTLPELDGILAADALGGLRVDLDYPNDRLLIRCLDHAGCTILPAVLGEQPPSRAECDDDELAP